MSRLNVAFLALFFMATALIVGGGLLLMDPPHIARGKSLDRKRVQDLIAIASAVQRYRQQRGQFPAAFADLVRMSSNYLVDKTADPETLKPYQFHVTGSDSFELCAEFAAESDATELGQTSFLAPWRHSAGPTCYVFRGQSATPQPACLDCQKPDPHIKL